MMPVLDVGLKSSFDETWFVRALVHGDVREINPGYSVVRFGQNHLRCNRFGLFSLGANGAQGKISEADTGHTYQRRWSEKAARIHRLLLSSWTEPVPTEICKFASRNLTLDAQSQ